MNRAVKKDLFEQRIDELIEYSEKSNLPSIENMAAVILWNAFVYVSRKKQKWLTSRQKGIANRVKNQMKTAGISTHDFFRIKKWVAAFFKGSEDFSQLATYEIYKKIFDYLLSFVPNPKTIEMFED